MAMMVTMMRMRRMMLLLMIMVWMMSVKKLQDFEDKLRGFWSLGPGSTWVVVVRLSQWGRSISQRDGNYGKKGGKCSNHFSCKTPNVLLMAPPHLYMRRHWCCKHPHPQSSSSLNQTFPLLFLVSVFYKSHFKKGIFSSVISSWFIFPNYLCAFPFHFQMFHCICICNTQGCDNQVFGGESAKKNHWLGSSVWSTAATGWTLDQRDPILSSFRSR